MPETITPKFHFRAGSAKGRGLLSIQQGTIGYTSTVIVDINLTLAFGDRIAIKGNNGSGKSTFLKALMNEPSINKTGRWQTPSATDIGYLDQNYKNLDDTKSILDTISEVRPDWTHQELREHLNSFLFRKNDEIFAKIKILSGGERLRLSLCQLAACMPRLLLLDEVTNNVDLATKKYLKDVLSNYAGALIVISHDDDFLRSLKVDRIFATHNNNFIES